jgi:hypothetical protein
MNEAQSPTQKQANARIFALAHLAECCAEIVEMQNTSILRDGRVRELAKMYDFAGDSALILAENEVKRLAMQKLASSSATTPASSSARLAVIATCYHVGGRTIPSGTTILERNAFARNAGLPPHQAAVIAMQDRGASLAHVLGTLVAQSGNLELTAKAERAIAKWNDECDAFLRMK